MMITNILKEGGYAQYFGPILAPEKGDHLFQKLLEEINWKQDEISIFGNITKTRRKVAWHAEIPASYTYSRMTKIALPFTQSILELKKLAENITDEKFNSCLLNLYHDGTEGMGWHADDEKEIKAGSAIGSISLGADRKFSFKHKTKDINVDQVLEHGSLLVMKGDTQTKWKHCLRTSKHITKPRINLTFRQINS